MRTRTQKRFANMAQSAYEADPDEAALLQDNDRPWLAPARFRLSALTVSMSLLWVALVLGGTVLLGGAQVASPSFWVSGGLAAFLVVAMVPVAAVILFRWLDFRLRGLGASGAVARDDGGEADPSTSGNVIAIRHVVQKELSMLNEQLERSMTRTVAVEEKVRAAIDSMEKAFNDNERRLFSIVQELARQRESVSSATDQVRESVRGTREALQAELDSLTQQIVEAGNYARGTVEEVNRGLIDAVADAAQGLVQNITVVVQNDVDPLKLALDQRLVALRNVIANSGEGMVQALDEQRAQLGADMESALGRIAEELERQATLADEIIAQATSAVEGSLDGAIGTFETRIRESADHFRTVLDQGGQDATARLDAAWTSINSAFGARLDALETELERAGATLLPALDKSVEQMEHAMAVNSALDKSTQALETVLGERGEQLVKTVAMQFEGFHNAVGSRSEAISKALADKLAATFARIDAHAEGLSGTLASMEGAVEDSRERLAAAAAQHNLALFQSSEAMASVLDAANDRMRETIATGGVELAGTIDRARTAADNAMAYNLQVLREAAAQAGLELSRVFSESLNQIDTTVRRDSDAVAGTGRQVAADLTQATESMARDLIAAADAIAEGLRSRLDVARREFETAGATALHPVDRTLADLLDGLSERTGTLESALVEHHQRLEEQAESFRTRRAEALDREVAALGAVLEARSETLSNLLATRGSEFADRLSQSTDALGALVAETVDHLSRALTTGGATLGEATSREVERLGERLKALGGEVAEVMEVQSRALAAEFAGQKQALAEALKAEEKSVRQIFSDRTKGLEKTVAGGVEQLTAAMAASGAELSAALNELAAGVRSGMTADAEMVRRETGARLADVSGAITEVARSLEAALKESVAGLDVRLAETAKATLGKLSAEEKAAIKRMEQATAAVTESTRRAAEVAAERVVALNGAVVQALSTLGGTGRKGSRPAADQAGEAVGEGAESAALTHAKG